MSDVPSNFNTIQQPGQGFNQPVSENMLQAMGGALNGLLGILLPVGSIIPSMLGEPAFQGQLPTAAAGLTWVLADGRNVAGSTYASVTSSSTIPDLRGLFLRGSNNGGSGAGTRADGKQNPDGVLATGTYTAFQTKITDPGHAHTYPYNLDPTDGSLGPTQPVFWGGTGVNRLPVLTSLLSLDGNASVSTVTTGIPSDNQTASSNVTINWFIRIN